MGDKSKASNHNSNLITIIMTGVALACLVISLVIHIDANYTLEKLSPDDLRKQLDKNPLATAYFYSSLFKEIAFALIIAVVIGLAIERAAKSKQLDEVRDYLDDIQSNVFDATLKKNVPDEIVDVVFQNIYTDNFLRKNSRITIRLLDFPDECEGGEDYILYEVEHNYEVHSLVDHKIDYDIHIYGPEPALTTLREFLPDIEVMINGQGLSGEVIRAGADSIPNSGFEERFRTVYPIPPKDALSVSTKHSIAKYIEDAELWVTMMPQIGMDVTVEINTKRELTWDIDSLFFGELVPNTTGLENAPFKQRRASFSTKQAILPYHGVNINWRPVKPLDKPICPDPEENRET